MSKRQPTEDMTDAIPEATNTDTAKEVLKQFGEDDVPGMAAEIAYHIVFALAPLLLFIISLAVIVDTYTGVDVAGQLQEQIQENAPSAEVRDVLDTLVQNAVSDSSGGIASFGAISTLLLALWSGSNAIATLMKAFNRAYDVTEARSFVKKKLVAMGLTLLMALFINLAFVLFVFGGDIGNWVADWFGLGSAFTWAWNISRFPIAIISIMLLLAILYYFGPNIDQSFRWISPGAVIATLLWIAAVFGFQIYLTFSDPGSAYGAFGGLIVLLFFLYVTGIVFLVGAEINAVIGRQFDPETVDDIVQGRVEGELPEDTVTRTAQLAPRRPGRRRAPLVVAASPAHESESEPDAKTKVIAFGAVSAAAAYMMVNKVKGIFGK